MEIPGHDGDLLRLEDGFDASVYFRHFAPFPWTYVRGFRELFELLFLQPNFDSNEIITAYLKGLSPQVIRQVPDQWKAITFSNAHWSNFHHSQIERICAGNPTRLDRGGHAILTLKIAFELSKSEKLNSIDVFDYLDLTPAVYCLRNLSDVARSWLKGAVRPDRAKEDSESFAALLSELCPADGRNEVRDRTAKARAFLSNVADGYALTYESAKKIQKYVGGGWGTPRIVPLSSRNDCGRRDSRRRGEAKLRCCDFEGEFIQLDARKLSQLQQQTLPEVQVI